MEWSDWFSLGAVVMSASSLVIARRHDRRDRFLRLHEMLISSDQQANRRIVYQAAESKDWPTREDPRWGAINSALANFETALLYVDRRYVLKDDFMELWSEPISRLVKAAEPFLAARRSDMPGMWPRLRKVEEGSVTFQQQRDPKWWWRLRRS